ncbi:MFS transporter [Streptomyces sp. NPDC012637]|uniref:MFS transporter n=1 Tax=Streptomyces sp. NPDC012637 TaxID=3364842 RepID=UPI0036F01379
MNATHAFRSLAVRNFRLFVAGQIVSVAGTWMTVVAQDWLVLSLTDDSATALGTVTALQFTPMLLLTLYGGRLADRHDKRRLLVGCNLASALCALALLVLVVRGAVTVWQIGLLAFCLGVVNSVEVPTRMSFVGEMVGPELLPNASALSGAYFSLARVLGPALAGLLIAGWGTGPVIALNAASYLATVAALRAMRPGELLRAVPPAGRGRIRDGLRHARDRPDVLHCLVLVGLLGVVGFNFQLTVPLLAKTVFHADATSFGLLSTAFAGGALLGALAGTARRERPSARTVTTAALGLGVLEAATGRAPSHAAAAVLLALTGFAAIGFAQAANHRVQLGCDPGFRGRVLALYTVILQGSTPLGALLVGVLARELGVRGVLFGGGVCCVVAALAVHAVGHVRGTGSRPAVSLVKLPRGFGQGDRARS